MKLIALKRLRYPSGPEAKEYEPGDSFEASDSDAGVLKKIQKAKDYDGPKAKIYTKPARPEGEGQTATGSSQTEGDIEGSGEEGDTPRRRYRRRDLRPEE